MPVPPCLHCLPCSPRFWHQQVGKPLCRSCSPQFWPAGRGIPLHSLFSDAMRVSPVIILFIYLILFKTVFILFTPGLLNTRDPYPSKPGPMAIPAGFTGTGTGRGEDTWGLPVPFTSFHLLLVNPWMSARSTIFPDGSQQRIRLWSRAQVIPGASSWTTTQS